MKTCPECNTKNINTNKECDKCGTPIEGILNEASFDDAPNNKDVLNQLKDLNKKVASIEIATKENKSVEIDNIDMPFFDMVAFMVKWAIAAIPAMIILSLMGVVLSMIFSGLFRVF